jgi:monomeric isocitrate dehydrogenase
MIQIRVAEDMLADGISVYVTEKSGTAPRRVLRVGEEGRWNHWDELDPHGAASTDVPPTIRLTDDQGRALLDALLRHYQGWSEQHTLRADYLAERKRVDDMLANMGQLVILQAQR